MAMEKVMNYFVNRPAHTRGRVWLARGIAMAADAIQLAIFPLFVAGGISPVNDALDVIVAVAMVGLLGWHWAFLPAVVTELVPGLDLIPSWTAAVFFVTRATAATPTVKSDHAKFVPSRVVE